MKSLLVFCVLASCFSGQCIPNARAEGSEGWVNNSPPGVSGRSTDRDELYVNPKFSGKEVEPGKLYIVEVSIRNIVDRNTFEKSNIFYKKMSFAAQNISFHSTPVNGADEIKADSTNHLINIFSVSRAADGTISQFSNNVSRIQFVAEGRNIRYIAPFWMTQTDVEPSTASKVFFALTNLFIKAIPVLRLPATPTTALISSIPDLQEPYKAVVDVFDKAKKTMLAGYALRERTQFDTKTASISIAAKEIKSFNEVYGQPDQTIKDGLLAAIRAYAERKDGSSLLSCPALSQSLREDYQYDEPNQAFVMGYVGQRRGFADSGDTAQKVSVMLNCIAKPAFLSRVLNYPYNRDEPDVSIDEDDINNFRYSWADVLPGVNSNYATALTVAGADGLAYIRGRSTSPTVSVRQIGVDVLPLGWFLAGDWSDQKPEDVLQLLNARGFKAFGCAGEATTGAGATILALPPQPPGEAATYAPGDALKLAMSYTLVSGRPAVARITLQRPTAAEVGEKRCRDGLKPFAKAS